MQGQSGVMGILALVFLALAILAADLCQAKIPFSIPPDTHSTMNNSDVAHFFTQIAELMELKGENPFKIRAYRRAAEVITTYPTDITADYKAGTLKKIPGIGDAISDKIGEIITTGRLSLLQRLEAEVPVGVAQMLQVPDLGPKTVMAIYNTLGIASLDALETAAREGKLRDVSGVGAKSEQKILAGIASLHRRTTRNLLGNILPRAEAVLTALHDIVGGKILKGDMVGSLRRRAATIGDIDLLVAADPADHAAIMEAFRTLPLVQEILAAGDNQASVRLHSSDRADLRIVAPHQWGGAFQYFTGSLDHNTQLQTVAQAMGYTMEEYCLRAGGSKELFFETEADLYGQLGLQWIPPELREGEGEIEAAQSGELPDLVELDELAGDLHMHTNWSDGGATVLEMAHAARAFGYEYIVITDHSQSLAMTNGLSVERLIEQRYEIINANAKFNDFAILQGAEVEIRADGSLDYPDEVLAKLDVVVASMHTGIRGDRETLTRRMLRAIENPHVDIIGHMTNRLIGRREGADLDMDAVLAAAAEHGTILEINSQPDRLDLDPVYARRALEYGCLLSVDSDAHSTDGFDTIRYGLMQARRAWAENDDIINTRPLEEFLSYIREKHGE